MSHDARRRRYLVQFQVKVPVEDDYGDDGDLWTPLCDEYVDITFGTGQERRAAAQDVASQSATFFALANGDTVRLTTSDRILYPLDPLNIDKSPVWDITSIVPSKQAGKGFDITAVSRAP